MQDIDAELLPLLACPIEGASLRADGSMLECEHGHRYPVVEGVPVLLRPDVPQTIELASQSLALADKYLIGDRDDPWFVDSIGVSDQEKAHLREMLATPRGAVDPVVSCLVAATNGILYKGLVGRLEGLPISVLPMPFGNGQTLLDIGCSWGRWSMAAARNGYRPVGVDPSLGAVLAARRQARASGVAFHGIVGDARYLPLMAGAIDAAWSYSVLQHFSKEDAKRALINVARVVRPGGAVKIQMASAVGLRSFQHLARRRFREPESFDVRYWLPWELRDAFREIFGDAQLSVDCYFGLGLQSSDAALMSAPVRCLLKLSDALRGVSSIVTPLAYVADSLFITSENRLPPTIAVA